MDHLKPTENEKVLIADVDKAVKLIRERESRVPDMALVLGSGLGDLVSIVEDAHEIPTSQLPCYPESTVVGHDGRLVFGRLEGRNVLLVQGRAHIYEGYSIRTVTFPIRLVYSLGARGLVITNAAGGVNPNLQPGTIMFITDQINLAFSNPLVGPNLDGGSRFPDMSEPYDRRWIDSAERTALKAGIGTHRGVYLFTMGPSYETKAEIKMFAAFGADAVGMSTVPEVLQARYLGMRVLGISAITNRATGLGLSPLAHDEVLQVGRKIRGDLANLIRGIVRAEDV